MKETDYKLADALRRKFGTSHFEPTPEQLASIKTAIAKLKKLGSLTEQDWRAVVKLYCPSYGTHKYAGLDMSDLNTLLALALRGQ